jgi:hypothetical protein
MFLQHSARDMSPVHNTILSDPLIFFALTMFTRISAAHLFVSSHQSVGLCSPMTSLHDWFAQVKQGLIKS